MFHLPRMVQECFYGLGIFVNIDEKSLGLPTKMSRTDLDMNDNESDTVLPENLLEKLDEIDLLKAKLKEKPLGDEEKNFLSQDSTDDNNGSLPASEFCETACSNTDVSDKLESLCQSTETLIDNLDVSQSQSLDGNAEDSVEEFKDKGRMRNLSGTETVTKPNNHNEIALATSIQSGLLISPSSLTQDVPVEMGSDNKRISSVLESLDLQLVYIPATHQLVAAKAHDSVTANENKECENKSNGISKDVSGSFKNEGGLSPDYKSDSTLSTPTKMATTDSSSLNSVTILSPTSLDDSSSICETDCLIKIKEPDQLTCDSSEFECNFPRINTNDSLLRTFTDASSLSSLSTGTDFSVSAASLDDGETGMCIDTGDGGFMEINLHSRNSYERAKNPSQDSGFEDRSVKPKRKGLSAFLSRNIFSRKSKETENDENAQHGWKLFGKIPPKQVPTRDPDQVLTEYQQKQQTDQLVASRGKKEDIEVTSTTALILENRPMNLPSKDPEEAERHKQQYEAMVEAAKRKEQKELKQKKKQQQQQLRQEELLVAAAKTWTKEILPNWETMKNSKKTRDMWWYGIPPSVRGKVWQLAFGNDLNITQELYEICVSRAADRIRQMDESPEVYGATELCSEPPSSKESSVELIKLDVSRTFPQLCIFQKGGPYHDLLHSLLGAYACYRPDVGYVQGMSFIAAVLLLNMDVADAFKCFANLLNRPCQVAFFRIDEGLMKAYVQTYEEFFTENMPNLHKYFIRNKLTSDLYLYDWIFTLFTKSLPLDVACRVWDVFYRDGEEFLFRTALGILKMHEEVLVNMDFIHLGQFLKKLPETLSPELLFKAIDSIQMYIDKKKFSNVLASKREALKDIT